MAKLGDGRDERLSQHAIHRQVRRLTGIVKLARQREFSWVSESGFEQTVLNILAAARFGLEPSVLPTWETLLDDCLLEFSNRWKFPPQVHPLIYDGRKNRWLTEYQGAAIPMRRDQILSSLHWGNGFVAKSDAYALLLRLSEEDLLETLRMARDIAHIWQRFSPDGAKLNDRGIKWNQAHPFEHLIIDILNESHMIARQASRDEDFFELTDIRVKYPELSRRRGARLQVTLIQSEARLSEKLERIRLPEELIILSSHSLSAFLQQKLSPAEVQSHFRFALAHPTQHPAGPSQLLPDWFRQAIRDFVKTEALRSTEALRQREKTSGRH